MSLFNNDGVVFHDIPGGGWYCNRCKQYIHHDLVPSHKHTPVIDMAKTGPERPLKPLKSAQGTIEDKLKEILWDFDTELNVAIAESDAIKQLQAIITTETTKARIQELEELLDFWKRTTSLTPGVSLKQKIVSRLAALQKEQK